MASSAFATNSWTASTGSWGSPPGSTNTSWRNGGGLNIVPDDTEQVKILGGTTCDLDVTAVTFTTQKLTVGTSATRAYLNIKPGGTLTSVVEIQVGDSSNKIGTVTQTGGTVNLWGVSTKDSKLEVGYKTDNATLNYGHYKISGGSITSNGYSQLLVGCSGSANGGNGTFTVQGALSSISVGKLYVATQDSVGTYYGTGTLEYEINGGVSAIQAGSVYIDSVNASAVSKLNVSLTGVNPLADILLINNTGTSGIQGVFDTLNGGSAAEGATVVLGGVTYTLTYQYAAGGGLANDVALLVPEPATIGLLGLGLLALRRNKK